MKKQRILIIRLSALGDVAMTIPVIYSLAEQYPQLEISVLTSPFFSRLFINKPVNIRLIEADFKRRYKGIKGIFRLLRLLRACQFNDVADLHNILRSWIIDAFMCLNGVRVAMVDKKRKQRGYALKHHIRQPNFINRYAEVFAKLGFPVHIEFNSLFTTQKEILPVEVIHPAIGIAPFARYANKTYPIEKMETVVKELTENGYYIYLFGSKGEEAGILAQWSQRYKRCIPIAGNYSIEIELAIMSRMNVMLTMDSANQHLAAATGVRVVTLWGSTTPLCGFLGFKQSEKDALLLGLPCQPCSIAGGKKCKYGHFTCMKQLSPQMIVAHLKQIVSKNN